MHCKELYNITEVYSQTAFAHLRVSLLQPVLHVTAMRCAMQFTATQFTFTLESNVALVF